MTSRRRRMVLRGDKRGSDGQFTVHNDKVDHLLLLPSSANRSSLTSPSSQNETRIRLLAIHLQLSFLSPGIQTFTSLSSTIEFDTHDRTVAAAVVDKAQAPPAMTFLQALHSQIPTAVLFTESFPQKVQVYLLCCEISIFLTDRRRDEPGQGKQG